MKTIALDGEVRAGRVLDRAFMTVRRNPMATTATAFLFAGVPATAFQLLLLAKIPASFLILTVAGRQLPGAVAILAVSWFVSQIFGTFTQGAMAVAVTAGEEGRKARLGEMSAAALRCVVPLFALGALLGISIDIGVTLFVIPAIFVFILWSVAPSAITQEGDGMFMALDRSQELGQGRRWKIFGILLIVYVSTAAATLAFGAAARFGGFATAASRESPTYVVGLSLLGTIVNLVWATVLASLYVELREAREGGSVGTLEQVFA